MRVKKQEIFPTGTIYEKIFHYLWKHPVELENKLLINIPQTVVFKNMIPSYWYFTDKNGNLKKKKSESLSLENIYETMTSNIQPDQVCCYMIYSECSERQTDPTKVSDKYSGLTYIDQSSPVKIQYFNTQELHEFLFAENIPISAGILQKFIPPPTENNCVFLVKHKSKLVQYSKITNKQSYTNAKMDKFERCCTFDGPDYFITTKSAAKCTSQNLKSEVDKILSHLSKVSYGMIAFEKLDFYFKIDNHEKVILLFIANVRLKDDQLVRSDEQTERTLFKDLEPIQSQNPLKPYQIQKLVVCLRCKRREVPDRFQSIPYKYIIQERGISQQPNNLFPNNFNQLEVQNPRENLSFVGNNHDTFNSATTGSFQNEGKTIKPDRKCKDKEVYYKIKEEEENEIPLLRLTIDTQEQDESFTSPQKQQQETDLVYKNHEVPGLFSILHPKLDYKSYTKVKEDFSFQHQQIQICLNCYMEITPFLEIQKSRGTINKSSSQFRQGRIKETRSLDSQRYQITQSYQKDFKEFYDRLKEGRQSMANLLINNFALNPNDYQLSKSTSSFSRKERSINTPFRSSQSQRNSKRPSEHEGSSLLANSKDLEMNLNYQILAKYTPRGVAELSNSQKRIRQSQQIKLNQIENNNQTPLRNNQTLSVVKSLGKKQEHQNSTLKRRQNDIGDSSTVAQFNFFSDNDKQHSSSISAGIINFSASRKSTNACNSICNQDVLSSNTSAQKDQTSKKSFMKSNNLQNLVTDRRLLSTGTLRRRNSFQNEQQPSNQFNKSEIRFKQQKLQFQLGEITKNALLLTNKPRKVNSDQPVKEQISNSPALSEIKKANLNNFQSDCQRLRSISSKIQIYSAQLVSNRTKRM